MKVKFQAYDVPIKDIFEYMSGLNGLYNDVIYKEIDIFNKKEKYKVLSSAIKKENQLGYMPDAKINNKKIPKFKDKEGILIARKGKAGTFTFLKPGKYTLTEVAYVIYKRADAKYNILLEWFYYAQQKLAYDNASNSDNGTFSIERFMNEKIDIPDVSYQQLIINGHKKLNVEDKKLELLINKVDSFSERFIEFKSHDEKLN
ncbi:hypothetical protein LCY76_23345 [Fictibacillus sp. KIGAM418]|uniref:Uncharacterized protein n=1 Tax=Fictibacillus marinisediminis TaxID=2878389 RepID=A0A9X2BG79_9BACL|nr:hypothetical protein [Fictibacillus marinisediminis]MCK6259510.1 hypothetical protein [Fictibacillus marinisediminis]